MKLYDFPKDNQLWRIHWLGRVSVNNRDPSNPLIDVLLAPWDKTVSLEQQFGDDSQIQIRHIGVGLLPDLTIGSVWLNGEKQRQFESGYTIKTFTLPSLSTQNAQKWSAKYKTDPEKNHWLIPPYRYKLHKEVLESYLCLLAATVCELVIPNTEIARFYFATSSYIAQTMLSCRMGANLDRLYYSNGSKLHGKNRHVILHQKACDVDATIIALMCCSPYATSAANRIFNSVQQGEYNFQKGFVQSYIPFQSKHPVKIMAEGIWLVPNQRFLVFRIISSDIVFPEDVELFTYSRHTDQNHKKMEDIEYKSIKTTALADKELPQSSIRSDREPRKYADRQQIQVEKQGFSPSIIITKSAPKPNQSKEHGPLFLNEITDIEEPMDLSTGEGTSRETPTKGASLFRGKEQNKPYEHTRTIMDQDLEAYFLAISELKRLKPYWKICFVTLTQSSGKDDDRLSALPITEKKWNGQKCAQRHLACAEIIIGNRYAYFVDIERKTEDEHYSGALIWQNTFSELTPENFSPFVNAMIAASRWPKQSKQTRKTTIKHYGEQLFINIPHSYADATCFAAAIAEKITMHISSESNQGATDAGEPI